MKNTRTYKHTQKYLQKKAEKELQRKIKLAKKRDNKIAEIADIICSLTPYTFILEWLKVRYDITESEFLFGSIDFTKINIIKYVRLYLDHVYNQHESPTVQGLEEYLLTIAIEEFCNELGISEDVYDSLKSYKSREEFVEKALNHVLYCQPIDENLTNSLTLSGDELIKSASEIYDELNNNDIRRGSKDVRNKKRLECVKFILENFKELQNGEISLRKLEEKSPYNRDTLGKYYNEIKNLIRLGQKIDEHTFDENKRGRKPNSNPTITKAMLDKLEQDLEDIPEKCGLNYASWTGEAIHEYFMTFYNLNLSMKYLYKFLHSHNIISKFASRKNPKADPEEVALFKRKIYEKFKRALINNETVVFLDETQIQQGSHARGFAKKGKKSVYSYHTENLHSEYTLLTVIGFNFCMMFKHKGSMKANDYADYLKELHEKYPNNHFVIFRDNARIHTAEELGVYFEEYGLTDFIRFESFPKYSPELNPVELLNNEFKAALKIYACENKTDVSKRADIFIEQFQDANKNSKTTGRRKARQYLKGKECVFIYEEYLRAMKNIRLERLKKRRFEKANTTA